MEVEAAQKLVEVMTTIKDGGVVVIVGVVVFFLWQVTKQIVKWFQESKAPPPVSTLPVTGVSINDAGVKNDSDSEVIVADALLANAAVDTFFETTKHWLGQVTLTLSSAGGSTFNWSGNYGFAKHDDFGDRAFVVTDFEVVYRAGANESAFDVKLRHHKFTGWTYHASAFVPGSENIASLATDYGGNVEFDNDEHGSYKRSGLAVAVDGTDHEGVIIEISTAVNNSLSYLDAHIGVFFTT